MPETEKERTDRQLIELLNELRVALPGAQVLLAFLLTAPSQAHFTRAFKAAYGLTPARYRALRATTSRRR